MLTIDTCVPNLAVAALIVGSARRLRIIHPVRRDDGAPPIPRLVAGAVSIRGHRMGRGFGFVRTGFDVGVDCGHFRKGG